LVALTHKIPNTFKMLHNGQNSSTFHTLNHHK